MTLRNWRDRFSRRRLLEAFLARRRLILTPVGVGWGHELSVIRETRKSAPLLLSDASALQIQVCVKAVRNLGGHMAEAGVLAGASARLICEAKGDAPLHLFDVFESLQSAEDGSQDSETADIRSHFGPIFGERAKVEQLLARYQRVLIHQGVFPQSASGLLDVRFSFVHVDLDLPCGMRRALEFFHPRMIDGGIMIGDDYDDPAVRAVFATYFEPHGDTVIELPWGQVMVVKQTSPRR